MELHFRAIWDGLVKGVTLGVFIILVTFSLLFSFILKNVFLKIGIIILYLFILSLLYLWAPQSYAVNNNIVVVKRLIGDLKIPVAEKPERWDWTWWGIRLFGSGGLYGYYGLFTFKGTGRVYMYATNRHNLILIKNYKDKKYLLSPDEPVQFIQAIHISKKL